MWFSAWSPAQHQPRNVRSAPVKGRSKKYRNYLILFGFLFYSAQAAEIYPAKSIRLVHGYAADSAMDFNARELIALAKARPGVLSYGSNRVGRAVASQI